MIVTNFTFWTELIYRHDHDSVEKNLTNVMAKGCKDDLNSHHRIVHPPSFGIFLLSRHSPFCDDVIYVKGELKSREL